METNVSNRSSAPATTSPGGFDFPTGTIPRASTGARSSALERSLLRRALHAIGSPRITVVLWDDEEVSSYPDPDAPSLVIKDRWTLWKILLDPWFHFGQAYAEGRIDVPGDLEPLLTVVYAARERQAASRSSSPRRLGWFRRRNTLAGSRHNIHHHYDIGNDFYKLWLDNQLLYTCAYFADPTMTLEEAQVAKMDHVCRKLGLKKGDRVLEAGCGWGALALHMARHYGVTVKAFNISREQIVYARREAQRQCLTDRVEFVEADWRTMDEPCDAFVSVGMLEHVGPENYRKLGKVIHRCLAQEGRGLIHSIGQNRPGPTSTWIQRRIFPGAYPPALGEIIQLLEPQSFSVLDVENLRLHYAETLRHWLRRYEQHVEAVRQMFDEQFVRAWRLYLCGSLVAFETGGLQLFQVVFSRGTNNRIPWTRAGVYSSDGEVPAW